MFWKLLNTAGDIYPRLFGLSNFDDVYKSNSERNLIIVCSMYLFIYFWLFEYYKHINMIISECLYALFVWFWYSCCQKVFQIISFGTLL